MDRRYSSPECESPQLPIGLRRYSLVSNDSRMSDTSNRKFSTMANQVEKTRRMSKSFGNYKSPYSKKNIPEVPGNIPKVLTLENTYQMSPKRHFPVEEVRQIIVKTLQNVVGDEVYANIYPNQVSKRLSQLIKDQVKSLNIDRFKIVCVVTIGEMKNERIQVASRCLWDNNFDRFASATVKNGTLFAVGTVYGVYFE